MKTIELTVWERVNLVGVARGQTAKDLDGLRQWLKILEILNLTEEEQVEIGLVQDGQSFQWEDAERLFEMEFEDADYKLLKDVVKAKSDWPVTSAENTIPLLEKFLVTTKEV